MRGEIFLLKSYDRTTLTGGGGGKWSVKVGIVVIKCIPDIFCPRLSEKFLDIEFFSSTLV